MEIMTKQFKNVVETVLGTRRRDKVIPRRDGDVPQRRYWVSHLGVTGDVVETYLRNVVDTYYWDVLVTYHWDVVVCFIWDLSETSWRHTDGTSSLRPLETLSRHTNEDIRREDVFLRRLGDFHWDVVECFNWEVPATSLGRTERRRQDVLLPDGILVF